MRNEMNMANQSHSNIKFGGSLARRRGFSLLFILLWRSADAALSQTVPSD